MANTVTKKVAVASYSYRTGEGLEAQNHTAARGEVVEVPDDDRTRAHVEKGYLVAADAELADVPNTQVGTTTGVGASTGPKKAPPAAADQGPTYTSGQTLTDEQLAELNVEQVKAYVDANPTELQRVLDLEEQRDKPRAGVQALAGT